MAPIQHRIHVRGHPGSSLAHIESEPAWGIGHQHRIGYKNQLYCRPGLTHPNDKEEPIVDKIYDGLKLKAQKGSLTNFRQLVYQQEVIASGTFLTWGW